VQLAPDVGGDGTINGDEVMVVWQNATLGIIQAVRIEVSGTFNLGVASFTRAVSSGPNDGAPAIAKTGGPAGRFLIVWEDLVASSRTIKGSVVDRGLNILHSSVPITVPGAKQDRDVDVDGDGQHWVVAYQTRKDSSPADGDVECAWVTWHGPTQKIYANGPFTVAGGFNNDEANPAVAFLADSALVSWASYRAPNVYDAHVRSIDHFSCLNCEGAFAVDVSAATDARFLAMAVRSYRNAMLVWEARDATTSVGVLKGRRFTEAAGQHLSGSNNPCGLGGLGISSCPRPSNANYRLRLEHAEPNRPAFLILGLDAASIACGPCQIVVDPFTGLVVPAGLTNAWGNASFQFQLPTNLSLVTFRGQWVVVASQPACAALGVDFSLQVIVQLP
jgi:hypothetical protein